MILVKNVMFFVSVLPLDGSEMEDRCPYLDLAVCVSFYLAINSIDV